MVAALVGCLAATRASDIAASDANTRISEANPRAEEAKLETERLKQEFAWRESVPSKREPYNRPSMVSRFQLRFLGLLAIPKEHISQTCW